MRCRIVVTFARGFCCYGVFLENMDISVVGDMREYGVAHYYHSVF